MRCSIHRADRSAFSLCKRMDGRGGNRKSVSDGRQECAGISGGTGCAWDCAFAGKTGCRTERSCIRCCGIKRNLSPDRAEGGRSGVRRQDFFRYVRQTEQTKGEREDGTDPIFWRETGQEDLSGTVCLRSSGFRKKTDILLSNAFQSVVFPEKFMKVRQIILPDSVIEIQAHALAQLEAEETVAVPDTVTNIGADAFRLGESGYITCHRGTRIYEYCQENHLQTSVDMEDWRRKGLCQYCGGHISFILRSCKACGRPKDY